MLGTLNLSKDIKIIVSDFDGIFTDNSVFVLNDFTKLKKVSYKDLMGVSIAIKNDLKVAIISGEESKEIDYIAQKFNLTDIHQGIRNKLPILNEIKAKYGFNDNEIVYIGDDVNDIECLNSVAFSVTVPEANYKVREIPQVQITREHAGDGAFREVVDNILEQRL